MPTLTIPEGFAATGALFLILAAVTFVAIVTADQYGERPDLWRAGSHAVAGFVAVAVLCALAAIWSSVLA